MNEWIVRVKVFNGRALDSFVVRRYPGSPVQRLSEKEILPVVKAARWEHEGKLVPDERTAGGYRRYDLARLRPEWFYRLSPPRKTVAYARVSSHDQKDDLARQKEVLELYCANQG